MKRISISLFFLLIFLGFLGKINITGEIFIVTQGGQNYKLGLVKVGLIRYDKLKPYIEKKAIEASDNIKYIYDDYRELKDSISVYESLIDKGTAISDSWTEYDQPNSDDQIKFLNMLIDMERKKIQLKVRIAPYEKIYLKYVSGEFFFSNMPKLEDSTKTDSDGRFNLTAQTNKKYFIVAEASRSVGEKKENYYWMIEYPNSSFHSNQKILLSNDNLLEPSKLLKLDNE